jgi:hypothetical protein
VTVTAGGGAGGSSLVAVCPFSDCGRSSFHVIGKVLVEIFRVVVVEVETLREITLGFFRYANHEDFTAKVLNVLVLFA